MTHAVDPVNCPVGPVLEFLQEKLAAGAATTNLRVYIAAISALRELDDVPLGRHRMVSAFMRGVWRLRPVRPIRVPSWDLPVVIEGLMLAPFEPLESAPEQILTLKVTLLLVLTSLKRVGDLQALSVSKMCMDFALGLVKVTLRPRPGYVPKVLSTSFRSQVVMLPSFHSPPFASGEDERLHMLHPVLALKIYVDHSKLWRKSPQLLVCFGAGRRGFATSKYRISYWVKDDISLAYKVRGLPSPLSIWAHSSRSAASSQALFRGVLLEDICVAAGWSSLHTFIWFYNLDLDTAPGSQVLSVWTGHVCIWFVIGSDRAAFLGWCVWYIVPKACKLYAASREPMKENVSGYPWNPCSLNRERDAAFAAKLLTLPTRTFFGIEIWGADGAFASIRCDMRTSGVASAPSANELVWFYTGFRQSARPGYVPKARKLYAASRSLFREQGLRE